ncbi:MAG TPA: YggS family pyridoxal phosphate-dependent enzyme [Actinomycetota bacterium]|nr:YggS family pyridoxal phosphate-dependent enzyme [Actinomycetota bacterium]
MTADVPLIERLDRIRVRLARACERSGRTPEQVRLVAVTKTLPPSAVSEAWEAGLREFGENYVKELERKRTAVPDATWHFIGTLQSHTAHKVAEQADVVQTLASTSATERLARRAATKGRRLPALIEVDFTGERSGVSPDALADFADEVSRLEGLRLVGLMTLPPIPSAAEDSRPYFRRLRALRDALVETHQEALELSMGMSLDYEVALEEGATIVRIGTALFGERPRV